MDAIELKVIMDLMSSKGLTFEDMKLIRPELAKEIRVAELESTEEVTLYLQALETEQVKEYLTLTAAEVKKGKGHGGKKSPMDCLLCGKPTHRMTWAHARIDGVQTHIGTLSEKCEKFDYTKVRIPFGTTDTIMDVPLSEGQLAGRLKEEKRLGFKSEEELSTEESSTEESTPEEVTSEEETLEEVTSEEVTSEEETSEEETSEEVTPEETLEEETNVV